MHPKVRQAAPFTGFGVYSLLYLCLLKLTNCTRIEPECETTEHGAKEKLVFLASTGAVPLCAEVE